MKNNLSIATIEAEEKRLAAEITSEFSQNARSSRELELSEVDVAQFLATQLVIPIIASFMSDFLYDKFKDLKTKKQAQDARKELNESQVAERRPVERAVVVKEVAERLTTSMVRKDAETIVTRCYERLEREFQSRKE